MFQLLFLVLIMILYKKYLWYISTEDAFEKINFWLGRSVSRQLGSAGAFRPDLLWLQMANKAAQYNAQ